MLFNSATFPFFLALVLLLYYGTGRSLRAQNLTLLLLSYLFYSYWDVRFLSLILFSTAVDYWVGLKLTETEDPNLRKPLLWLSLSTNLGLLGIFKYFDFFLDSLKDLALALGWTYTFPHLDLILPVGISFYTFQSMSYTIDVYRRKVQATHDLVAFACYVAFFPQLVAGPIERATHFLPQVLAPRKTTWQQVSSGTYLIVWGLFLKVFVGDNLAPISDQVFADPTVCTPTEVALGNLAFMFQVYADFAGYSKIARGVARLMGFELSLNFNLPYLSLTPMDFWRRWHITLSHWLRDYLFIPLGGSRGSKLRVSRNILITMALAGLWHGADWTFVLWGVCHGFLLIFYRYFPGLGRKPMGTDSMNPVIRGSATSFWTFVCFALVYLTMAVFRVEQVSELPEVLGKLLQAPNHLLGGGWQDHRLLLVKVAFYTLPVAVADLACALCPVTRWRMTAPWPLRIVWYLTLFYAIVLFGGSYGQQFFYFQF